MRVDALFESVAGAIVPISVARIRRRVGAAGLRAVNAAPRIFRMIPAVAVIAVAATILGAGPGWSQTRAPSPRMKRLSAQDTARIKQIITGVIHNPSYLTPAVHAEFWRILARTGATAAAVQAVRERMTGMLTVYYPLFWQDALISLRNRRPYKSARRQQYERKLLAQRIITMNMVKANDALIAKIAAGKPIVRQGRSILFNEPTIQAALRSVQATAQRIDRLFAPPRRR